MKPTILATAAVLTAISLSFPSQAENFSHTSQLLSTKQCPQCDLSNAGLVMANLSGAQLAGANLTNANLSRANLSGADLSGANLSGASLYGANLTGTNLSGAILNGTDLRDAYLSNANLTDVNLDTAYIQGAIGIPYYAGTPEQFHRWGLVEAQRGNYQGAIDHYNRALSVNPNFAPAYLGRGLVYFSLGNGEIATKNAEVAAKLFEAEGNTSGYEASQNLIQGVEAARNPNNQGNSEFAKLFQSVASMVLQFLLR